MSEERIEEHTGRLSRWQAAMVIARRDFVAILFSRTFIFFLLGPLFPIIVGALAGGIGTIYGAILGALIMQSLQSGMAMVGVDAPLQNIVVGSVLVAAVLIDIIYRRRVGG